MTVPSQSSVYTSRQTVAQCTSFEKTARVSQSRTYLPMPPICPGIQYYIQNVDSGTFLELAERASETEVKTRSLKDSAKQLWTAVPDQNDSNALSLQNVAHRTWLGIITDGSSFSQLVGQGRASASKWWVEGDDDGYRIGLAKTARSCLELHEFGAVLVRKINHNDSQRWRFLTQNEAYQAANPYYANSFTTDFYRIRTLDGTAVISLSGDSPDTEPGKLEGVGTSVACTSPPHDSGSSQKWLVSLNDDGTCSIQETGQLLFLGCKAYDSDKYGGIYGLKDPFIWQISSVGGFAYMISTYSLSTLLSIGFRDYQAGAGKQLALMPTAQAHSQIWFFEKWEDCFEGEHSLDSSVKSPVAQQKSVPQGASGGSRGPFVVGDPGPGMTPVTGFPNSGFKSFHPDMYNGPSEFPEIPIEELSLKDEDTSDLDSDNATTLATGHYFIRNVALGKYLSVATRISLKNEPTHAPTRFFVRVESASSMAQFAPHSYAGVQSLIWREPNLVVEDKTEPAWRLIPLDEEEQGTRFYLKPIAGKPGKVLAASPELELVDFISHSEKPNNSQLWDFVLIF